MAKATLYLETTSVPAGKTIGEITALLVRSGATQIMTTYDNGKPAGVKWSMRLYGIDVWFRLPVKVESVFKVMLKSRRNTTNAQRQALQQQAERVAWRQLLAWVQVQIAMVHLEQADYGQVFFPYLLDAAEQTAWDAFKSQKFPAIEAPKN